MTTTTTTTTLRKLQRSAQAALEAFHAPRTSRAGGIVDTATKVYNTLNPFSGQIVTAAAEGYSVGWGDKAYRYTLLVKEANFAIRLLEHFDGVIASIEDIQRENQVHICSLSLAMKVSSQFHELLKDNYDSKRQTWAMQKLDPEWYRQLLTSQIQYLHATLDMLRMQVSTVLREIDLAKRETNADELLHVIREKYSRCQSDHVDQVMRTSANARRSSRA